MKFKIGKVLKPRGLRGELKIQILTNLVGVFSGLKKVYLGDLAYDVSSSSVQNNFAYIKISGVESIEAAEEFRCLDVFVTKSALKLESDDILSDDILSYKVLNVRGKVLGTVDKVESFGERVILNFGATSFPYEDDFVVETKIATRQIIVREEMLQTEVIK